MVIFSNKKKFFFGALSNILDIELNSFSPCKVNLLCYILELYKVHIWALGSDSLLGAVSIHYFYRLQLWIPLKRPGSRLSDPLLLGANFMNFYRLRLLIIVLTPPALALSKNARLKLPNIGTCIDCSLYSYRSSTIISLLFSGCW